MGGNIYGILENNTVVYVGQTIKPIRERWNEHISLAKTGKGFLLHEKMRNNGLSNFSIVLLEKTNNNLVNAEKYWIKTCNTHISQGGYNLTWGGETSSESLKKKCYQYDLEGNFLKEFDSVSEASRYVNGDHSNIVLVLQNKLRIAYGFRWSYNKVDKLEKLPNNYTGAAKPVYQYDLNKNFIRVYNSTKEAAKILGRSQGNISSAANGIRKTAYGFIWSYSRI